MSSGGGSGSTVNTTSNLPEYSRPYFERLMDRSETESEQPYTPYTGPRIAGFTGDQNAGFGVTRDLAATGTPDLDTARSAAGYATSAALGSTNFNAAPISTQAFDGAAADRYMSPYMDRVVDRQKTGAIQDFLEGQGARDQSAIGIGAFGGARHGVAEGVARRGLEDRLATIEATGLQSGYENAQGQFERDRSAAFTTDATNEANRREAARVGQAGAELGIRGSEMFGNLGAMDQGLTLQRSAALQEQGRMQQELGQRGLDTAYDDFVNQRDYGRQQLTFLNSIMRGVPYSAQQEVRTTSASNPWSQMAGLGVAGLGAYRMLGS